MDIQFNENWIKENVTPYKQEVDDFLEKASHPDKSEILRIVKEAHENKEIPKIINFCYVNYKDLQNCYYPVLHSWIKNMPDYLFINWTPAILPDNDWTIQMIENKKWAFYADYARVYAVYNVGGFYIDCDVFVYKSFDDFIKYPYVFDLEYNSLIDPAFINRIDAGVFGARTHMKALKYIVSFYNSITYDVIDRLNQFVAPFVWNEIFKNNGYITSWRHKLTDYDKFFFDESLKGKLDNIILVLDSTYLSRPNTRLINRNTVAENIGIREIMNEQYAYASHQMFSEWVPK